MGSEIIAIVPEHPLGIGGGRSLAQALGRAALMAGYEPHFFCPSERTRCATTAFGKVHEIWAPIRRRHNLTLRLEQPFLVSAIERFLARRPGPYLLHCLGPEGGTGAVLAGRLRRRHQQAVVLVTPWSTVRRHSLGRVNALGPHHSLTFKLRNHLDLLSARLLATPSERRGLMEVDLILPRYDSVQAIIEAEFGVPPERFGRMAYASAAAFRDDTTVPARPAVLARLEPGDAPLIISASRHDPRKCLDVLLFALGKLKECGTPFRACLLGAGALLDYHRRLAARLGLSRETVITGEVEDPFIYLRHGDIFVLPSLEEGSGSMSLLEAMQAELAPVVSRVDGLVEDVSEGESALFVTPGDAEDLARALTRCLRDPDLRKRIAAGARARYLEAFSAERFANDLKRIYTGFGFTPSAALG